MTYSHCFQVAHFVKHLIQVEAMSESVFQFHTGLVITGFSFLLIGIIYCLSRCCLSRCVSCVWVTLIWPMCNRIGPDFTWLWKAKYIAGKADGICLWIKYSDWGKSLSPPFAGSMTGLLTVVCDVWGGTQKKVHWIFGSSILSVGQPSSFLWPAEPTQVPQQVWTLCLDTKAFPRLLLVSVVTAFVRVLIWYKNA